MTTSGLDSVFINPDTVAEKTERVLPSAKLYDDRTTKRKRSFDRLKRIGPKIILVGHPKLVSSLLYVLYGRTACDLSGMNKYKTKLHQ